MRGKLIKTFNHAIYLGSANVFNDFLTPAVYEYFVIPANLPIILPSILLVFGIKISFLESRYGCTEESPDLWL